MTMLIKPDDDLAKLIAERVYSRFGHLLTGEDSAQLAPEVHRIVNEAILSGRPDQHPAGLIVGVDVESASGAHAALDTAKVPRLDNQGEPLNLYGRVRRFIASRDATVDEWMKTAARYAGQNASMAATIAEGVATEDLADAVWRESMDIYESFGIRGMRLVASNAVKRREQEQQWAERFGEAATPAGRTRTEYADAVPEIRRRLVSVIEQMCPSLSAGPERT